MDFTFSEEQEMLRNMARSFLGDKCQTAVVREAERDPRGYSPGLWQEIAGLGWTGLVFPEAYGGGGMGFLDLAIMLEEAGRACLPAPFLPTVVLGGLPILELGDPEQKKAFLPRIVSGNAILTLAVTETDGLYQARSIQTRAVKDGSGYVLTGKKLFVPDACIADFIICAARTGDVPSEDGISLFIVDAHSPGVACTPLKSIAGRLGEVAFDSAVVSGASVLGPLNAGWQKVDRVIQVAALARCCEMLGAMQQVLDMTVAYAKERKQFDRPIGSFQIIQHYCARMAVDLDGARFGTYCAAWKVGHGLPCRRDIAVAKAFVNDASRRVLSLAHEIHGAVGITLDHDLQLYTRRIKAGETSFGDADFHREVVAAEMLS